MSKSITAPGDNSHAHRCAVCDAQIPCDNPENAQLCEVGATICAPCEEGFRDQDADQISDDRERSKLWDYASDDGFDEMFKGEDQMGKQMLEDSQAIPDSPVVAASAQEESEANPSPRAKMLRPGKRRRS